MNKFSFSGILMAIAAIGLATAPVANAQVESFDPDSAASNAATQPYQYPEYTPPANSSAPQDPYANSSDPYAAPSANAPQVQVDQGSWNDPYAPSGDTQYQSTGSPYAGGASAATTYQEDDLIGAAQGVFGDGAEGIASLIRDILKKQGQPSAYIAGREGGAAFVVGARYGSGTLYSKTNGQSPIYWRGPSIGFDAGANAGSTFVLVYNLFDDQKMYGKAFGAGEAAAYFVGGFHVSYLRKGNVVLIPVRLGVGLRLGANVGYMKFSAKQKWLPF